MRCIYCGTPLSAIDYCTGCGADISLQKRTIRISNLLYNEGLEKATVRDLSGAIACLKRSLKFNKENIDARNLLGLVYYEMGEVVSALSEWVISKNLQVPENAADGYITKLQANKNKLDTINHTIRKYNQALQYCRQDNEDMAVIQLKKVLTQNPKLIKGYHLLALLYLKQQEYERARKLLRKAIRIDATNTTTLRYLHEIEDATGIGTSLDVKRRKRYAKDAMEKKFTGPMTYLSGNDTIIQPTPFRDSSTIATFINIFLGLLLGGAIVWFLAVPAIKQSVNQTATKQVTEANTKLASENASNVKLQEEIDGYQAKVDAANKTMDEAKAKATGYEDLLKSANLLIKGDQTGAASALSNVDAKSLDGSAKELYEQIMAGVKDALYAEQYSKGSTAYAAGDYKTAIEQLTLASQTDPESWNAMYYLAFAYYNTQDTTNADKIFKQLLEKFPAESAANNINGYISNKGNNSTEGNNGGTTGNTPGANTGDTTGNAAGGTNGNTTGGDANTTGGDANTTGGDANTTGRNANTTGGDANTTSGDANTTGGGTTNGGNGTAGGDGTTPAGDGNGVAGGQEGGNGGVVQ